MDYPALWPGYVRTHSDDLGEVLTDQSVVVQSVAQQSGRPSKAEEILDRERWDKALAERLVVRNKLTATDFGSLVADDLESSFDAGALDAFLLVNAGFGAENINGHTEALVQDALDEDEWEEALSRVFLVLLGSSLERYAESTVTTSANFGMTSAAEQGDAAAKTWTVNSGRPRASHASMSGESVPLGESFSNGMQWPGDPAGGADENANCRCSVDFER